MLRSHSVLLLPLLSLARLLGWLVLLLALEFGGPPPHPGVGGPPPRLGAGGPPSRLGGPAGFRGGDRGIPSNVRGVQGRSAAYAYRHSARYGHGYRAWRDRYWTGYGAAVYGDYGDASADGDCRHTYTYSSRGRAYRRILVCD